MLKLGLAGGGMVSARGDRGARNSLLGRLAGLQARGGQVGSAEEVPADKRLRFQAGIEDGAVSLSDSDKRDMLEVISRAFEIYREELRTEFAQTAVCIIEEVLEGLAKQFAERTREAVTLRDEDRRKFFDDLEDKKRRETNAAKERREQTKVGFTR